MESVSNPLIEQVDSDSDSGIEMSEVEVETEVETAEVGREYEETMLISDIIEADPDAKSWEGHLKVEHNEGLICQAGERRSLSDELGIQQLRSKFICAKTLSI